MAPRDNNDLSTSDRVKEKERLSALVGAPSIRLMRVLALLSLAGALVLETTSIFMARYHVLGGAWDHLFSAFTAPLLCFTAIYVARRVTPKPGIIVLLITSTLFLFLPEIMDVIIMAYKADGVLNLPFQEATLRNVSSIGGNLGWFLFLCAFYLAIFETFAAEQRLAHNIAERERAQKALKETEEHFQTMLRSSRDIAYELDLKNRRYNYMSAAVETYTGYTVQEVIEMGLDGLGALIHPEDREQLRALWQKHRSGELPDKDVPLFEYRLRCRNGEYRWFANRASFIRDESGELVKEIGAARDITESKQAEQALLAASRLEATATLAGGIAHDFNNLMVGVLGNAELLQEHFEDDPYARAALGKISRAALEAGELSQKMLAFARGGKYQPAYVDLNKLIQEVLALNRHAFPKRITIGYDLAPNLWSVRADAGQMAQVLMNISHNAVEAIEQEGCIKFTTQNVRLEGATENIAADLVPGDYVFLRIQDDGAGMSDEVRARAFEPFFSTKFQGRGLGLAAVYGTVKNHGGAIELQSREGHGTSVTIHLPAAVARPNERRAVQSGVPTGSETILVVDDEEMVLDVLHSILDRLGYQVLIARNGQEALDVVGSYTDPIHLVLLDMGMPVMNGSEVFPLLRDARPDMRIVICSGYELDPAAQALIDAGASTFIQKPFRPTQFAQTLREVLDA